MVVMQGPCREVVGEIERVKEEPVEMNGERLKGVWIRWLFRGGEARAFAFRVFRVEPGAVIPAHRHPWEHGILVLRGRGVVRIGQARYVVKEGSFLLIPPNVEHEYVNLGDEDWMFLCVIPSSPTVGDDYDPCRRA